MHMTDDPTGPLHSQDKRGPWGGPVSQKIAKKKARRKVASIQVRAVHALTDAFHAELQGRDGLPCRVWRNPSIPGFADAVREASGVALAGLRGLVTAGDFYVWQSTSLLHTDFERQMGISGIRLALRSGELQVNDETVDQPEHFPWVFPQPEIVAEIDIENRRGIVTTWLLSNERLQGVYPHGFKVVWYS
jgi:hypothetical protein